MTLRVSSTAGALETLVTHHAIVCACKVTFHERPGHARGRQRHTAAARAAVSWRAWLAAGRTSAGGEVMVGGAHAATAGSKAAPSRAPKRAALIMIAIGVRGKVGGTLCEILFSRRSATSVIEISTSKSEIEFHFCLCCFLTRVTMSSQTKRVRSDVVDVAHQVDPPPVELLRERRLEVCLPPAHERGARSCRR